MDEKEKTAGALSEAMSSFRLNIEVDPELARRFKQAKEADAQMARCLKGTCAHRDCLLRRPIGASA